MVNGIKLIPINGLNLDVANAYLQPSQARYIKNLYYQLGDFAEAGTENNSETGKLKPIESNAIYCPVTLPDGDNFVIGTLSSRETKELYVFVYNSLSSHLIFRINGATQTADVAKENPCFDFKLSPEYFIGEGQCYLDVNTFIDPDNGNEVTKKDLYWTDGNGYQGFIRFDDYLATGGYNPSLFPYFAGDYDVCSLVRVGLPTPKDCITYTEVSNTVADEGLNNNLLFKGTQFRITYIDVFGRPSEHGIISDLYIAGINDCFSGSSDLPRCLDLSIYAGNPLIDKIQVEFSNDNEQQWYLDTVLNLYTGSSFGAWWLRARNPDITQFVYDPLTNRIIYRFCRTKECTPIDTAETNKLEPALAMRSQAIGKVAKRLGFANNKYGFNPFSQTLKDKIHLTITPPAQQDVVLRDITIYVCLNTGQGIRKKDNQYYFGGRSNNLVYAGEYKQLFPLNQKGWVGYLNDGSYTISKQFYFDPITNKLIEDKDYLHGGSSGVNGAFVLQQFVFTKKQAGSYVFRLADHEVNVSTNPNFQKTSTTVFGLCPFTPSTLKPFLNRTFYISQELIIDTCNGDYNTLNDSKILVIMDCASFDSVNMRQSTRGYITEDIAGNIPIELMSVVGANASSTVCNITDHNGFYWFIQVGGNADFTFNLKNRCNDSSFTVGSGNYNGMRVLSLNMDTRAGFQNYSLTPCNRMELKGRIVIQNSNIGVPNVTVTYTRSTPVVTDAEGNFTIVAHDQYGKVTRTDSIIFGSSCSYKGANGICLQPYSVSFMVCAVCDPSSPPASPPIGGERVAFISPYFEFVFETARSLLSGGTYGWGFTGYDWLGRRTFLQLQGNFTIPSIIQSQVVAPSILTVTIDPTAIFPPDIKYIVPAITAETTQSDYLDWIVDAVEFIDNTGEININSPTQIKIYYGSIIEFNKQNNYNTTTAWQFIVSGTNTAETADKIQFFINGDGTFFTKTIIGLVKYALDGQYVLIDYTSDLKDLQKNAYIRLIRPKVCTGNEPFYEVCQVIDIVDQKATVNSFVLNAWDTYYLSRQIPVPVPSTIPAVPPATTDTIVYTNELRVFGFNFEHHSPSNFWGYKIWNRGRLNVSNPYEAEILMPDEIQLSGTLSSNGQLNYVQNFDNDQKKNFIITNTGGITYFNVKSGIICFITQFNNFIVGYNDNLARVVNGNLQVPSGDSAFGNPERRTNGDYGCALFDKSTIREKQGLIHFLDTSRVAVLQHNFSEAMEVSKVNKANSSIYSWLLKKVKYIQEYNRTNEIRKYFHGVINPANAEYILTDFTIGSSDNVNQARGVDVTLHESIAFDVYYQTWKAFYSCVPEYYGFIEGEKNGQQLFSFASGVPYYHYRTNEQATYGTIFGQIVERVYDFIITMEIMKKQRPTHLEVYAKGSGYFSDLITTEAGQQSRILKEYFRQGEFMHFAPFLRDLNTPADSNQPLQSTRAITEGNPLFGEWMRIRLIGYPEDNTVYSQLSGIQVFMYGEMNTGKRQQ